VVISWQRAEEQARDLGHSLLDELIILTIHGVLHLLGYQDEEERERERMWARQEELRQLFLTKEGP
jgi:probable rRNA maturation factor